jgi:hypothetical protein
MSNFSLNLKKKLHKEVDISDSQRKIINRVILFTNARDEKNIKEWASHHLLLGFDIIYIFDHKSVVPLKEVFSTFDSRVYIENCNIEKDIKLTLMRRAATIAKNNNADWMIYLDADEFIALNYFKNIKQMLYAFSYADQLAINWLYFGSNNHINDPEGLLIDNYTKSDSIVDKHVKSFVRPSQILNAVNPHYYIIVNPLRNISINNNIMPVNPFNDCQIHYTKIFAFIAHYVFQSEETYIRRKVNLPTDDVGVFREREKKLHSKHNSTENLLLKNKYSENIKNFLLKFK